MKNVMMWPLVALLAAGVAGCGEDRPDPALEVVDDGTEDFEKGKTAFANNELKIAAGFFTDAAAKCETNFEARLQLALVNLRLGEVARANQAVAEALAICPESAEVRLVDGQVAYLMQDYARAVGDFNAVANAKTLPKRLQSEALAARAVVEIARQDVDAARITLFRAKRLDPLNAAAWYHLGLISRDTYHFTEAALEQFQMAARLMGARDERARRLSRDVIPALRAQLQQAAAAKSGADRRDPGTAAKLIAEGESLRKRKRIRDAIRKFAEALKADPLSDKAALPYAELLGANVPRDAKAAAETVAKALEAYRTVIDQNPSAQAYYLQAARLAYKHGQYMQCAAIMDRAISHDPENKQTLDLLVASLMKTGKTKQAEMWKAYRQGLK
ncbi:MAG: tetratricopeptide repeat protein [Kiritimatiellia bacterium]